MVKLNENKITVNRIYFILFGPSVSLLLLKNFRYEEYKFELQRLGINIEVNRNLAIDLKTQWAEEIISGDIHQLVIYYVEVVKREFSDIK